MKTIKIEGIDEYVYEYVCQNGLRVYVWVQEKANSFKGTLTYLCGAEDIHFKKGEEDISVPMGVAHYLEHIMCKDEKNVSLLSKFQKNHAYSNAATYPDRTVYEFVGTNHLKENLNLLLDSIQTKKFAEHAFETERGPIIEEARIQSDNANRLALYGVNETLFQTYHNHVCGTGRVEDIEKITLKDLQVFYKTFYHPLNSFLVVTGNVNPKEVFEIVLENQKKKTFPPFLKPKKEVYQEPLDIIIPKKEIICNVETPKTLISIKVPVASNMTTFDKILLLNAYGLLLDANYGVTSLYREKFFEDKLGLSLDTHVYLERDYLIAQIVFRSENPDKALKSVLKHLQHLDYDEKDILRKVKAEIANLVTNYEDVENVNDYFVFSLTTFGQILTNEKEMLENLTVTKVKKLTQNINSYPYSIVTLTPKKKSC